MTPRTRVAIFGGDGRQEGRWATGCDLVHYKARRDGGNGELRRIEDALRAGSIAKVIILARWNGHGATKRVRRLCRQLGIAVEVVA